MKPAPSRGLIAFTVMLPTLIEIIDTLLSACGAERMGGAAAACGVVLLLSFFV